MFDVVISNPPFGVTLTSEVRQSLDRAFSLPATSSTEALFIERAFQLLRPGGRLAVVMPESVLNAADTSVRLFAMRMFHIKAVVSLPRHIFAETPTLTSLLFAQKKTGGEITTWDETWALENAKIEEAIGKARRLVTIEGRLAFASTAALEAAVLNELSPLAGPSAWVMRRGQNGTGGPLEFRLPLNCESLDDAAAHYQAIFRSSGLPLVKTQAIFTAIAERLQAEWPCYAVDEVGFKLSKRGERIRENQLAKFVGRVSEVEMPNLHLANEDTRVVINEEAPCTVLDFMNLDVKWSSND
jgi:type I restriction enzyme M protein